MKMDFHSFEIWIGGGKVFQFFEQTGLEWSEIYNYSTNSYLTLKTSAQIAT